MPTFLIVLRHTPTNDAYRAVRACHQREPINNSSHYNSNFSQSFNRSQNDESLGTKKMINNKTGQTVTCDIVRIQATIAITDEIKATGCDEVAAFGFSKISGLLEHINSLEVENIKLKKKLKKIKGNQK